MKDEKGPRVSKRTRLRVIVGVSLAWGALLLLWLFAGQATLPKIRGAVSSHAWLVMGLVFGVTALFWIAFLRQHRRDRSALFLVLKACSDILLIALIAGLLIWNWSSTVLILIGIVLALSYGARFVRAAVALAGRGRG